MGIEQDDPEIVELIDRYNKWRRIYSYAGRRARDEPDFENARLFFRDGYPHPDWSALVIDDAANGRFRVLRLSTERRESPAESLEASFSRIEDAGKFIVYKVANYLRIDCQLEPITWRWRAAGLDPRVDKVVVSDREAKYILREHPEAYFIAYSGGIQPYNHILPMSYDELDAALLEDFPESVTSQLAAESS